MKAVVCKTLGPATSLCYEDNWAYPVCGDGEVLVDIKAAGLNFPDVLIIEGKYQFQPQLPFIPGGECAGIVAEVGAGVTHVKPGDAVICMIQTGGFASRVAALGHAVFPMPPGLSFEQAAGVSMTYFTSHHALKQRAQLQPGETLLVMGAAGGVGSTAIELGKWMGAKVIAAASSDEKLEFCKALGADEVINYSKEDLKSVLKTMTNGRGVDVVYDPVGGDFAEPALRNMAWNGRYLVVGFASGPIPKIPLNLALLKGCAIVGVFWGRFVTEEPKLHLENVAELWGLFENKVLNPQVTESFALSDYQAAFECMTERRARGKVILTTGD